MNCKYGLITDDSIWAAILSSYFQDNKCYFPIISLPRMQRPDWQVEVYKRVIGINRSGAEVFFIKEEDCRILQPLWDKLEQKLIPLKEPEEALNYIQLKTPREIIEVNRTNQITGLLKAVSENKILSINDKIPACKEEVELINPSNTIVIIEKSNEITDISAVNYALSNNYDAKFLLKLSNKKNDEIKNIFIRFSEDSDHIEEIQAQLTSILLEIVNYKEIEKQYERILFITSEMPLGILIENKRVAHLFHLQSELRFIDEYFYNDMMDGGENSFVPSFLFVDIQDQKLKSEIPEITRQMESYEHWSFYLNGAHANRKNFEIYSRYFPFDLMFVTGHGHSPKCRNATYRFMGSDGKMHVAKIFEYFQFGRIIGDEVNVEVEKKDYPLEFDGINWNDKKAITENGLQHIFRDYINASRELELIEAENIKPKSIQGLLLTDGVFLGTIHTFSCGANPILFFNTCGSLIELGGNMSFAGGRVLIGTMWSIYDDDANEFANKFFASLPNSDLLESFYISRSSITNKYSKLSYVYYGTLNSRLPIVRKTKNNKKIKKLFAERLVISITEALHHLRIGIIGMDDFPILLKLISLSNKFIKKNVPFNIQLRKKIRKMRKVFNKEE